MFSGNCFQLEYTKKFPFVKISKDNLIDEKHKEYKGAV